VDKEIYKGDTKYGTVHFVTTESLIDEDGGVKETLMYRGRLFDPPWVDDGWHIVQVIRQPEIRSRC
jgi:hypothetical protein